MLTPPVAGEAEQRGGRGVAGEGAVVADIDPEPGRRGLATRQERHGGVVAVQPLGGHDMSSDQRMQRRQRRGGGADLVGERREAELDALAGVALGLAVQRLVLAELLEQDHRQQARAGPAARRRVERRRRLGDALAVATGELLPHRLDHLPLPRDHLQRLGDVLAELHDPARAAATAGRRGFDHHPLARQMPGKGLARRAPALEAAHRRLRLRRGALGGELVLGGGGLELLELQLELVEQPRLALGARAVEGTP